MIPVACLLEVVFDKIRYSRDTKLSIGLVLVGVGVCTVTDVSVNTKGFVAAFVAVWSTALQQYVSSQSLQSNITSFITKDSHKVSVFFYCSMCIIFSESIRLPHSTYWVILLRPKLQRC